MNVISILDNIHGSKRAARISGGARSTLLQLAALAAMADSAPRVGNEEVSGGEFSGDEFGADAFGFEDPAGLGARGSRRRGPSRRPSAPQRRGSGIQATTELLPTSGGTQAMGLLPQSTPSGDWAGDTSSFTVRCTIPAASIKSASLNMVTAQVNALIFSAINVVSYLGSSDLTADVRLTALTVDEVIPLLAAPSVGVSLRNSQASSFVHGALRTNPVTPQNGRIYGTLTGYGTAASVISVNCEVHIKILRDALNSGQAFAATQRLGTML